MNTSSFDSLDKFNLKIFSLIKDSFIYGIASSFSKLLNLLSIFLLLSYFTVDDFGIIDFYLTIIFAFTTFLSFGLDSGVARFFYNYDDLIYKKKSHN